MANFLHSWPAWTLGPRAAHPKFGGGVIIGGIESVTDRLLLVKEKFPDDLSSGHIWHEIAVGGIYAEFNSPNAIPINTLKNGIKEGDFPNWSAFTAPAFGLPGLENGSILSQDAKIRDCGLAGHIMAIEAALDFKAEGIGEGIVIWWPAFDSRLHRGPLSKMKPSKAWGELADFWVNLLSQYPEAVIHLEYKPSVPGQLDWIPTMRAAIDFCNIVNEALGRIAMVINLEWAHALIGGQRVLDVTKAQIEAELYTGFFHANSAELAIVTWTIDGRYRCGDGSGSPGDDADWAAGEGGDEIWRDEEAAIKVMVDTGKRMIIEHDIDPAGEAPIKTYSRSRENIESMLASTT